MKKLAESNHKMVDSLPQIRLMILVVLGICHYGSSKTIPVKAAAEMSDCSPPNGPSSWGTGGGGASWSVSSFSPAVLASTSSSSPAATWSNRVCESVEVRRVEVWRVEVL